MKKWETLRRCRTHDEAVKIKRSYTNIGYEDMKIRFRRKADLYDLMHKLEEQTNGKNSGKNKRNSKKGKSNSKTGAGKVSRSG